MALSNTQYNTLLRRYEAKQLENQHIVMERIQSVYQELPRLLEIDNTISSLSVSQAKKLIGGDDTALPELHRQLQKLIQEKNCSLPLTAIQSIILNRLMTAPTAGTPVILTVRNAIVFNRQLLILSIPSPTSARYWTWKIFRTFHMIITLQNRLILLPDSPAGTR